MRTELEHDAAEARDWREDDIWESIYCSVKKQCGETRARKLFDQETHPENVQLNR